MQLLQHPILNILLLTAINLWHSWCNIGAESNDAMVRGCTAIYEVISESIIVKSLKWVLMIQNWYQYTWPLTCGHVPYVHGSSKVNKYYCSINMWSSYCHSRYIYQSIHRGSTAGLILSLTTDNMYIIMFPGFWMCYPVIHMQELLMTASIASVDSPSI